MPRAERTAHRSLKVLAAGLAWLSANILFCLFYSRFMSLTPKGYVDFTKETGRRPCVRSTTKEILRPQRALCAFLGVWVPLTKSERK
jgi:hypothetical protein